MAEEKATMYAHWVSKAKPADNTQPIKDIVFLDEDGQPVALATLDTTLQVDKTQRNVVISLDDASNPAYLPVGNTGKAVLAAANGITPGNLASYDSSTDHGKVLQVKADGTGFDFVDMTAAYTDAAAVNAVKNKANIKALANLATDADLPTTVQKVNEVIAALKA